MNKTTAVAAFLVVLVVATATIGFFLNQINILNQTNKVQITAFSVDPKGWENPGGLLLTCSVNITLQNMGVNDVQELKLSVKMFVNGSEIDVRNNILDVDNGLVNDTLCAGEARNFRGEMQYSLHQGGAVDTIGDHPVGASYVAQVTLDGNDVLDEAELAGLFSFELTDTITLERHGGYYGIAYDSGKGEIYLTNGDFHLVYVISDSDNTVVATIPVGDTPSGITYDPSKGELFATNFKADTVSVISDSNYTVTATIPVGTSPIGIAYDSGKGEIFVANYGSDTVSVIENTNYNVVATIPVGSQPSALAYDSGKGEIYVGHAGSNQVLAISDTTNTVVANITVENQPLSLTYDSGKNEIFAANHGSDTVSVIEDTNHTVVATIPVESQPFAIDYDSVNNQIYVANYYSFSISVISDSNHTVIATIPLEGPPQAIGYDSGKGEIFVAYSESSRVSVISVPSSPSTPSPSPTTPEGTPESPSPSPSVPEYPVLIPVSIAVSFLIAAIFLTAILYRKKRTLRR
jgi:YVTN family beta-propeller protein